MVRVTMTALMKRWIRAKTTTNRAVKDNFSPLQTNQLGELNHLLIFVACSSSLKLLAIIGLHFTVIT
jgi:hypothetical protein